MTGNYFLSKLLLSKELGRCANWTCGRFLKSFHITSKRLLAGQIETFIDPLGRFIFTTEEALDDRWNIVKNLPQAQL